MPVRRNKRLPPVTTRLDLPNTMSPGSKKLVMRGYTPCVLSGFGLSVHEVQAQSLEDRPAYTGGRKEYMVIGRKCRERF